MKINFKKLLIFLTIFMAGFFIGQVVCKKGDLVGSYNNDVRILSADDNNLELINPLLDCSEMSGVTNKKIFDIRDTVQNYINIQKNSGNIENTAVYFRDLKGGPWFGINEKSTFLPASLLKVPLMIAAYKQAILQPGFINKMVEIKDYGFNDGETIKAGKYLKSGEKKSIGEIVEAMIKYSDNNAVYILNGLIDREIYIKTYSDLGIESPSNPDYSIAVRTYASFFRILYNSTYLDRAFSKKALLVLSESEFKDGLVAGVLGDEKIAHKFGERDIGDGKRQLHDCGIVYDKKTPYLLCIMTSGKDNKTLINVIASISKIVYEKLLKE